MNDNSETGLQRWAASYRGRLFVAAVYGAVLGVAFISGLAELLAR